jgi:murein DD-endopeptidase MepM/ murein hydrolase activator NlpD
MLKRIAKRKFTRVISLALICAALLITVNPIPSAQGGSIEANNTQIDALQREAEEIRRQIQNREQEIAALRNDVAQQERLMKVVDTQIIEINSQINAYNNLINAKQSSIDETRLEINQKEREIFNTENRIIQRKREIERLGEENDENIAIFGQIAAQMYMNSGSDAFSLLSGSTSFYDILVRAEMIRNIGENNIAFMKELLAAIQRQEDAIIELELDVTNLEGDKLIFENQQRNLEAEMLQLENEKTVISQEVNRQYNALYALTSERDELQNNVRGLRAEVESTTRLFNGIMRDISELEAQNRAIEAAIQGDQSANPDRDVFAQTGWIWPVERRFPITSGFGWCAWRNGMHTGVDFGSGGINGTNVFAVQSGTVIVAADGGGWNGGYGNYVVIDHGGGISTLYAHLQTGLSVGKGQSVVQGQVLGRVGNTGWSTGPHLHFEVRVNGTAVNPTAYIG